MITKYFKNKSNLINSTKKIEPKLNNNKIVITNENNVNLQEDKIEKFLKNALNYENAESYCDNIDKIVNTIYQPQVT